MSHPSFQRSYDNYEYRTRGKESFHFQKHAQVNEECNSSGNLRQNCQIQKQVNAVSLSAESSVGDGSAWGTDSVQIPSRSNSSADSKHATLPPGEQTSSRSPRKFALPAAYGKQLLFSRRPAAGEYPGHACSLFVSTQSCTSVAYVSLHFLSGSHDALHSGSSLERSMPAF